MTRRIAAAALVLSLVGSTTTFACTVSPPEARELPVEVVQRASSAGIVVFDAYKMQGDDIVFSGKVTHVYWGDAGELATARFEWPYPQAFAGRPQPHAPHDSPEFWTGRRANLGYGAGCNLVPNLALGRRYLYLRATPLSPYSLEPVIGIDDPWQELVRKTALAKRRKASGPKVR